MKKFMYLIAMLAIVSLSACSDDDNKKDNKVYADYTFNQVSTVNSTSTFSQVTSKDLVFNTTKKTADLNFTNKLGSKSVVLNLSGVNYKNNDDLYVFQFDDAYLDTEGNKVTDLKGYYNTDNSVMMVSYTVNDGSKNYYIINTTPTLKYENGTTIVKAEDGTTNNDNNIFYDVKTTDGKTATLTIYNFIDAPKATTSSTITFEGLECAPITAGYAITGVKAVKSTDGKYSISDYIIGLQGQCLTMIGSFDITGTSKVAYEVDYTLFPASKMK